MKKIYQKPAIKVCVTDEEVLTSTSRIEGNAGIEHGGEGKNDDVARGRRGHLWEDEE